MKLFKVFIFVFAAIIFLGCASTTQSNLAFNSNSKRVIIKHVSYSPNGRAVMGFDEKNEYKSQNVLLKNNNALNKGDSNLQSNDNLAINNKEKASDSTITPITQDELPDTKDTMDNKNISGASDVVNDNNEENKEHLATKDKDIGNLQNENFVFNNSKVMTSDSKKDKNDAGFKAGDSELQSEEVSQLNKDKFNNATSDTTQNDMQTDNSVITMDATSETGNKNGIDCAPREIASNKVQNKDDEISSISSDSSIGNNISDSDNSGDIVNSSNNAGKNIDINEITEVAGSRELFSSVDEPEVFDIIDDGDNESIFMGIAGNELAMAMGDDNASENNNIDITSGTSNNQETNDLSNISNGSNKATKEEPVLSATKNESDITSYAESNEVDFYKQLDSITDSANKIMDAVKQLDERDRGTRSNGGEKTRGGSVSSKPSKNLPYNDNNNSSNDNNDYDDESDNLNDANNIDNFANEDSDTNQTQGDLLDNYESDSFDNDGAQLGEEFSDGEDAIGDGGLELAGPVPSRTTDVMMGQLLEIGYPGVHWRYLECVDNSGAENLEALEFELLGRKISDENTTFMMKVGAKGGTYLLHFYTVDALDGGYLDDYLEVCVEDGYSSGVVVAPVYSYGDYAAGDANIAMAADEDNEENNFFFDEANPNGENVNISNSGDNSTGVDNLDNLSNEKSDTNNELGDNNGEVKNIDEDKKDSNDIVSDEDEKELLTEAQKMFEEEKWDECLSAVKRLLLVARDCADEGLFLQGRLLEEANENVRDVNKAIKSYETLIQKFPTSALYEQARRRIIYLRRFFIDIR